MQKTKVKKYRVMCDKCKRYFNINNLKEKNLKSINGKTLIAQVRFFECLKCGKKYLVFISDLKLRILQKDLQIMQTEKQKLSVEELQVFEQKIKEKKDEIQAYEKSLRQKYLAELALMGIDVYTQ